MPTLFTPLTVGSLEVPNRIFMAPLTRCRAEPGDVPGELIATYYAQRANAGLLIAEATMAIAGNCAFLGAPGVHSDAQVAGWRKVTDAVHANGGRIYLQIWHGGRACPSASNSGQQPVSASAIAIDGETYTPNGMQRYDTPRALADSEIPVIIEGFPRRRRTRSVRASMASRSTARTATCLTSSFATAATRAAVHTAGRSRTARGCCLKSSMPSPASSAPAAWACASRRSTATTAWSTAIRSRSRPMSPRSSPSAASATCT